jgi:hypothetical protein
MFLISAQIYTDYFRFAIECELANGLTTWVIWYNGERRYSSLDKRTPDEAYSESLVPPRPVDLSR